MRKMKDAGERESLMKIGNQGRRWSLNSQRKSEVVKIIDPLYLVPTCCVFQSSCPWSASDGAVMALYLELYARENFENKHLFRSFNIKEVSTSV